MEKSEDGFDTTEIRRFLKALGLEVFEENIVEGEPREFLNLYMLLYTSFFGNYEEIRNTLAADKIKTSNEALLAIYENQRSDEIPTLDGSITLMNAKFFDPRRYDLTKAGRYKLRKKLNAINRVDKHHLAQDILDADGSVFMPSGTMVNRDERNALRKELAKRYACQCIPVQSTVQSSG